MIQIRLRVAIKQFLLLLLKEISLVTLTLPLSNPSNTIFNSIITNSPPHQSSLMKTNGSTHNSSLTLRLS
jgi:hypothetical protein